MTKLEKLTLATITVAAAFNVFLFTLGVQLSDATATATAWLYWPRVVVAILAAVAFDLVMVVTVLGVRAGHRNRWSYVTAVAAALVSFLIGLDVAGVWAQPWLHAVYSFIVLAFMLHLTADSTRNPIAQPSVALTVQNVQAVQVQPATATAQPAALTDYRATGAVVAKPVTLDGVTYPSRKAAATALGISPQAVSKRARNQE